jgi:hypothetical protein
MVEARHAGQPEVQHHAIEGLRLQRRQGFLGAAHGIGHHVAVSDQLDDAPPLHLVVLDHQQPPDAALEELVNAAQRLVQCLAVGGLAQVGDGARVEAAALFVVRRDHVHGNVPGEGIVLQLVHQDPAVHVRQPQIQGDRVGPQDARHLQALAAGRGHDPAEAPLPRESEQGAAERLVVLDHEQHPVPGPDGVTVVRAAVRRRGGDLERLRGRGRLVAGGPLPALLQRPEGRVVARTRDKLERHEQGHDAPHPGLAVQVQLPAQQPGYLPADGEAEPRASVLAAGAAVRLLERFEDALLLVGGNADARVLHRKRDHGSGRVQGLVVDRPLGPGAEDPQGDKAFFRELERVREKVPQHLPQAHVVRANGGRQCRIELDGEPQPLLLGHVAE